MTFQPFQEEHQIFRKQVRGFAENELAPHVDQWEHEKIFPNSVFKRAGELGILGAHYPEDVGGGGGDFWMSVVKSEELARCEPSVLERSEISLFPVSTILMRPSSGHIGGSAAICKPRSS